MRTLRWLAVAALASVVAAPAGRVADAEDAPDARRTAEVRVYPVGALLRAHPSFFTDRGPGTVSPEYVNDEHEPLFGGEREEASPPLGNMERFTARHRAAAGEPSAWDDDDVEVSGVGESLLLVKAPRSLHDAIDARLAEWAREVCTTVVVDVALLEGDAEAVRSGGSLTAAIASGALCPLGVARVLPSTHGNGTVRDGGRTAYVHDHDTEVGCSCNVPDPIVGVVAQGLAVEVAALPSAAGRWLVQVQGFWADDPEFAVRRMQGGRFFFPHVVGPRVPVPPGGDVFQAVSVHGEPFDEALNVRDGVWTPVRLSGRRVLAVRLHTERPDLWNGAPHVGDRPPMAGESVAPVPAPVAAGPVAWRSYRIGDLLQPLRNAQGSPFRIYPSNYCPLERPPLPEPRPAITGEALRWLLERMAPAPTDEKGAAIEVRAGRLTMRADSASLEVVEQLLAGCRSRRLRRTEVSASVVTLPLESLPEIWSDPDAVTNGGMVALLARPGAHLVKTARLALRDGQRLAVVSGTDRSYLKDYDVELACTTTIGNPIMGRLATGLSVDVRADSVLASPLVSLLVRLDRGVLREMRALPTRFGAIQAPSIHEQSLRGAVTLAPGETRLFGLSASGPEVTLVLLSVTR